MKRGGPLKRSPLKSGKWSTAEAKKRRRARARARSARQFGPRSFRDFVHALGCVVTDCYRVEIQMAHVVKRSQGGTWQDVVPLCWVHHAEQEPSTERFEEKYNLDLASIAAATVLRWKERHT